VPPFTQALIIANVIGFLLQLSFDGLMMQWFALWPRDGTGFGALPLGAPWQLVTYSLLHGDMFHLLFNMFALWMFGSSLERVWGARRMAFTYVTAVIAGAIAQLIVGAALGTSSGPVIGASAGVFGILLAYALVFPQSRIMLLIPPIPLPARVFVALYAVLELFLGVTGTQAGVAHFAHLGGLLGGWLGYRYGTGMSGFGRK
jgi:membrane associated rhomboid family serine protease